MTEVGRDISAQRGFVDACAVKKSKRDRKEGRRGAREESVGLRSHLGRFSAVQPENEAAESSR